MIRGKFSRILYLFILAPLCIYAQEADFETTEIAKGVYKFRWQGHNTMFVITPKGIVAFDPISADASKTFGNEMKKKAPGLPLIAIAYSHSDADHATGANALMESMGVSNIEIIAHENAVPHIIKSADPALPPPTTTFSDRLSINFGGRIIEFYYFGPTHTDNLIIPFIPDAGVLFAVDFVNHDRVGYRELPSFVFPEWFNAVNELLQIPFDTVIFGHGGNGDRGSIQRQYMYYNDLKTSVTNAISEGKSEDEAAASIQLKKYSNWGQYEEWFSLNVRGMYRQLRLN